MVDSVVPVQISVPHGVYIVDPTAGRYGLKVNPDGSINVTGGSGSNASVGLTGAIAPTSATEIGFIDGTGKLVSPSAVNPLPIAGSFSASFTEPVLNVQGTASSAAVLSNYPLNPTTGYRTAAVQVTTITAGNTIIAEESNDGTTWYGVQTTDDQTVQASTPMTTVGMYLFPVSGLAFRLRVSVFASGTGAANTEFRQSPPSVTTIAVQGTPTVVLGAGSAIAGKFGIDQTTPGTTNGVQVVAALPAGAALLGKVGIDQTTPGTTNAVAVTNFPATQPVSGTVAVSNFPATQPVSGTVTANAGTNLNTSLLALETGGNLAIIAGSITSTVAQTNLKQVNGVTTLTGTGAVGTGAQRIAVGTDTATIAGSAPGTAGTPSTNVVTVQGAGAGTALPVIPDTANFQSGTASTTGSSTTSLIAAVTSKRIYVTSLSVSNSSATPITVDLQDGSGGATLWTVEVPATGGNNIGIPVPFCRTSSGVGLFFKPSAGVSTIYANAGGFSL